MKNTIGTEYIKFLDEIKSRIVTARIQAIRSVNKELIKLYWDIGRTIVERQKKTSHFCNSLLQKFRGVL